MFYDSYFVGMHFIWWLVWAGLLFWIFATPYEIPLQRYNLETSLDILQKRFASGKINTVEYHEKKRMLENDKAK